MSCRFHQHLKTSRFLLCFAVGAVALSQPSRVCCSALLCTGGASGVPSMKGQEPKGILLSRAFMQRQLLGHGEGCILMLQVKAGPVHTPRLRAAPWF